MLSTFRAPASKHPELTPAEFDASTVTHSFANRKRSFVKRRKSVLSSSFTPDDENEDELEAIKNDREATLAALERRSMQPIKEGTSKKKNRGLRRSISLTLPNTTPDYDISGKYIYKYKHPHLRKKKWHYPVSIYIIFLFFFFFLFFFSFDFM